MTLLSNVPMMYPHKLLDAEAFPQTPLIILLCNHPKWHVVFHVADCRGDITTPANAGLQSHQSQTRGMLCSMPFRGSKPREPDFSANRAATPSESKKRARFLISGGSEAAGQCRAVSRSKNLFLLPACDYR